MRTMTKAELMALPTIDTANRLVTWHMKFQSVEGQVWVDPVSGYVQVWQWRNGELRSLDDANNAFTSLPSLTITDL